MGRWAKLLAAAFLTLWLPDSRALADEGLPGPNLQALQLRFGGFFPEGGGEFWEENEDVFTLDVSDFDGFVLGFGYVHLVHNHLEVGVNVDFYDESVHSEYRDFIDEFGFPIFHETHLELIPITADVRFLPFGRYRIRGGGRQVLKPAFYVGGGLGLTLWEYEEVGDFLDFGDDPVAIFFGQFQDSGTAFEVHGLAGVEFPLGRRTNLLFEGRVSAAADELSGDFAGLGDIELGGTSLYAGFSFRF